jgi:serine/threonine-protein kinase RsbW
VTAERGPGALVCSSRKEVVRELTDGLARLGARTRTAAARSDWPERAPGLVFLDLVEGTSVVRAARAAFGIDAELVAVVDADSVDRLLPALAAGCGDYLFHPVNPDELRLRWRRHLSGRGGTRPRRSPGLEGEVRLRFPSRIDLVRDVVAEVVEACERLAFSGSRATLNLRVALGEALANAILYGNREDPGKHVRVHALLHKGEVQITISDEGSGFDPASVEDPTRPENRDRSHGRGLFLLRSLADDVRYNEAGNAVTLVLRS